MPHSTNIKPTHPKHRGYEEPKKILSRSGNTFLGRDAIPLRALIAIWGKLLLEHESLGHRITQEVCLSNSYSSGIRLEYTYEYDNLHYEEELSEYTEALQLYETELAAWVEADAAKRHPVDLDAKIERAKQRLANLEAMKRDEPIPFP